MKNTKFVSNYRFEKFESWIINRTLAILILLVITLFIVIYLVFGVGAE